MNRNVIYVGIDVDDERYHGSALERSARVKCWTFNAVRP